MVDGAHAAATAAVAVVADGQLVFRSSVWRRILDDYISMGAAKRARKRVKLKSMRFESGEGLSNTCRQIISLKCKLIVYAFCVLSFEADRL